MSVMLKGSALTSFMCNISRYETDEEATDVLRACYNISDGQGCLLE